MLSKKTILRKIIDLEGGFVDDPSDSGGATNHGITERVAREYGYTGSMCKLSVELAIEIYTDKYWDKINGDSLLALSQKITVEIIDAAINMGVYRAGEMLQRSLNVLNDRGTLYEDIDVDGIIGNVTVNALRNYLNVRHEDVIIKAFNSLQGAFYIALAERREKDERFLYGWLKNRV